MNGIKYCKRCGGVLEMILGKEFCACKDCKRIYVDSGGGHYEELVCAKEDGTFQPVFWINDQLSLQGPVVFAYFTSIDNEQHYIAGPSMKTIENLVNHINATPKERATLTIVEESKVAKLNLRFFDQAKKVVSEYQQTYYLGTH